MLCTVHQVLSETPLHAIAKLSNDDSILSFTRAKESKCSNISKNCSLGDDCAWNNLCNDSKGQNGSICSEKYIEVAHNLGCTGKVEENEELFVIV